MKKALIITITLLLIVCALLGYFTITGFVISKPTVEKVATEEQVKEISENMSKMLEDISKTLEEVERELEQIKGG